LARFLYANRESTSLENALTFQCPAESTIESKRTCREACGAGGSVEPDHRFAPRD
jgi:hypothetical protein